MEGDEHDRIERVAALCREAREILGQSGPFRLLVVLDMVEIECALECDRLSFEQEKRSPMSAEG